MKRETGVKIYMDISSKKADRLLSGRWKDAQHDELSEREKQCLNEASPRSGQNGPHQEDLQE